MKRLSCLAVLALVLFSLGGCEDISFRDHLYRIVHNRIARIVYHSGQSGIEEIFVMDSDGSHPLQLTDNLDEDKFPDWSPDGTRIAFSSDRSNSSGAVIEVFVMDADGSNVVQITTGSSGHRNFRPEWSPDGIQLAYTHYWDTLHQDIYVIDLTGGGLGTNLTNTPGGVAEYDGNPDWSPNGEYLVFMTNIYTGDWQIAKLEVAVPTNMDRITVSTYKDRDPVWSPDGELIAFHSNRGPGDTQEIYVIDADTVNGVPPEVRLTDNTANDEYPEWSPDGSRIIFISDRSGNYEIYTMNPDGTDQKRLTNRVANDYCPDWR
jgi:TolB protein